MEQRTTELEQLVRATGQSVDKLEVLASLLEKKVHRNHFLLMQVPRDRYKVPFTLYCTLYTTAEAVQFIKKNYGNCSSLST